MYLNKSFSLYFKCSFVDVTGVAESTEEACSFSSPTLPGNPFSVLGCHSVSSMESDDDLDDDLEQRHVPDYDGDDTFGDLQSRAKIVETLCLFQSFFSFSDIFVFLFPSHSKIVGTLGNFWKHFQ